jgi:SAM-dependent methyltransferase
MDLKATYNRIAEDWHRDHTSDTWWIEGTERFVTSLPTGASVLDAGCGAGTKSKYLRSKGLHVVGIDFSEKMIEIAKREVPDARFYVIDIKDLRSLSETFDGILAQAVLLHIPKAEFVSVLKELKSKLQVGGYLYLAVKGKRDGGIDEETKTENDYGYDYKRFFSYYTIDEIKTGISEIGMSVCYEHAADVGHTTWIQVIAQNKIPTE